MTTNRHRFELAMIYQMTEEGIDPATVLQTIVGLALGGEKVKRTPEQQAYHDRRYEEAERKAQGETDGGELDAIKREIWLAVHPDANPEAYSLLLDILKAREGQTFTFVRTPWDRRE